MKRTILIVALCGILLLTAAALAQPTSFTIPWWTVDGGGGRVSGGRYAINGTTGQFDAHTPAGGGDYVINGGYWQSGVSGGGNMIFLPLMLKP